MGLVLAASDRRGSTTNVREQFTANKEQSTESGLGGDPLLCRPREESKPFRRPHPGLRRVALRIEDSSRAKPELTKTEQ